MPTGYYDRTHLKKQFCPRGHDTFIVGRRDGGGQCLECRRVEPKKKATAIYTESWYDKHPKYEAEKRWRVLGYINESGAIFNVSDFNRLFQIQGGKCKFCDKHQTELSRTLVVDRNHETRRVRSLLCDDCNRRVVGDHTVESALRLVEYLKHNLSQTPASDPTGT